MKFFCADSTCWGVMFELVDGDGCQTVKSFYNIHRVGEYCESKGTSELY